MTSEHINQIQIQCLNTHKLFWGTFKCLLEWALGSHLGAVAGYLLAMLFGRYYAECIEPRFFTSFEEIEKLATLPYQIACWGGIVGAIIGIITVIYISRKLFTERILQHWERGIEDVSRIAEYVGVSAKQVELVLKNYGITEGQKSNETKKPANLLMFQSQKEKTILSEVA